MMHALFTSIILYLTFCSHTLYPKPFTFLPNIAKNNNNNNNSREDLITKFQADIPSFSQSEAESEVDKFLMDGEMLDLYIKYSERKREDPNWEPQYAEQDNSPLTQIVNFASQYAIWIVGGILLKDVVSNFMNKNGGGGEADVLVSSALDGIHHVTNTILA